MQGRAGRTVLDLPSILFIKLEIHCGRFAPLRNSLILFHKISVDLRLSCSNPTVSDWNPVCHPQFKA